MPHKSNADADVGGVDAGSAVIVLDHAANDRPFLWAESLTAYRPTTSCRPIRWPSGIRR